MESYAATASQIRKALVIPASNAARENLQYLKDLIADRALALPILIHLANLAPHFFSDEETIALINDFGQQEYLDAFYEISRNIIENASPSQYLISLLIHASNFDIEQRRQFQASIVNNYGLR